MSRHGILQSKRSKLIALIAAGAFTIASGATAAAMTLPGSPAAAGADSQSASVTSSQASLAWRLHLQEAAAQKAAAIRKAAAAKAAAAEQRAKRRTSSHSGRPAGSPEQIAEAMLGNYGWSTSQFSCLYNLWERESGWNVYADNPSSGAYGIPQSLPGGKMASAGSDWSSSAYTQIKWGLGYIRDTYGSPCAAWSHELSSGWY